MTEPQTTRIPNLLHLLLFLALTFFSLILCEALLLSIHPHAWMKTLADQRLQLFVNIATYAVAVGSAMLVFPLFWKRTFAQGISWNLQHARLGFIPVGLGLGFLSQAVSTLLPIPKKLPIEDIFRTPGIIWVLAIFGTLVAPLFEEIVFRGFLLPGIAIAVDYLTMPKSLEALEAWRTAEAFSTKALVFSSIVTSLCFAAIHAPQLGFSAAALALLTMVSLVLCYVRIRTKSVAASTLVHTCYNLSVFLTLFVSTSGFHNLDKL